MKKIFILFFILGSAYLAQASYLYWQVDLDSAGIESKSDGYYFNNHKIDSFRVVQESTPLTSGAYNGTTLTEISSVTTDYAGTPLYADVGDVTGTSYSYYIEIVGYDTVFAPNATGVIGKSTYVNANNFFIHDLNDASSLVAVQSAWSGQAYAVPEPTGAMLMIFGLAMLGLKRRKA